MPCSGRQGETIELQREFLEQYRSLMELELAEIYKDDGVSCTIPLHERPSGRQLLADARGGKIEAVLVYKLDRLGRALLVIVDAHDRLQEAGVALRSATEPIDTSNPSGRLIFQMLASFAEFERASFRERMQAGLHRALRNGKQLGMIPYGYDIASDGSFVITDDEAQIVAEIIANSAAGAAPYSEAERLNDEGVPSPGSKYRGKPRKYGSMWRASTVQGHLDEEELEVHQVGNLKLLISSVKAYIARKEENKLTAQTTEAWLLTLRERVEEVEEDTDEALEKRRELVKLLVEQIKVDGNEDGHTQVQITYRFGPSPRMCMVYRTPRSAGARNR